MPAQKIMLVDRIAYQPGSIVSQEIAAKKAGTVTLFAFDAGQGLSEHTAPFDAIVQILDGEAAITVSGNTVAAKAGELVVMPAGEPHSLKAEKRFKMLLIMIRS
jgi:quercetin dioxygenase-like cupin family protein